MKRADLIRQAIANTEKEMHKCKPPARRRRKRRLDILKYQLSEVTK